MTVAPKPPTSSTRLALFGSIPVQKSSLSLAANTITLYTITVAAIALTSLTARVTTVLPAAQSIKLTMVPTTGETTDLTTTVDVSSTAVGTVLGFSDTAFPMPIVKGGPSLGAPLILPRGTIRLTSTAATGVILFQCTWVPYEDGGLLA